MTKHQANRVQARVTKPVQNQAVQVHTKDVHHKGCTGQTVTDKGNNRLRDANSSLSLIYRDTDREGDRCDNLHKGKGIQDHKCRYS